MVEFSRIKRYNACKYDAYEYRKCKEGHIVSMDKEKQQLSVEVARLYYQSDYSQQEIANKLNISRPTISRLLKYAKEKGFVQIHIADHLLI